MEIVFPKISKSNFALYYQIYFKRLSKYEKYDDIVQYEFDRISKFRPIPKQSVESLVTPKAEEVDRIVVTEENLNLTVDDLIQTATSLGVSNLDKGAESVETAGRLEEQAKTVEQVSSVEEQVETLDEQAETPTEISAETQTEQPETKGDLEENFEATLGILPTDLGSETDTSNIPVEDIKPEVETKPEFSNFANFGIFSANATGEEDDPDEDGYGEEENDDVFFDGGEDEDEAENEDGFGLSDEDEDEPEDEPEDDLEDNFEDGDYTVDYDEDADLDEEGVYGDLDGGESDDDKIMFDADEDEDAFAEPTNPVEVPNFSDLKVTNLSESQVEDTASQQDLFLYVFNPDYEPKKPTWVSTRKVVEHKVQSPKPAEVKPTYVKPSPVVVTTKPVTEVDLNDKYSIRENETLVMYCRRLVRVPEEEALKRFPPSEIEKALKYGQILKKRGVLRFLRM